MGYAHGQLKGLLFEEWIYYIPSLKPGFNYAVSERRLFSIIFRLHKIIETYSIFDELT